jgi:predicted P-loop ATPase
MGTAVERLAAIRVSRVTDGSAWKATLKLTPTHAPKPLLSNALIALRGAPEWQGVLGYDDFALTAMLLAPPPWQQGTNQPWEPRRWCDDDDTRTAEWLQYQDIYVSIPTVCAAAQTVAMDHRFHPVRSYLDGLTWDGRNRVEQFATDYLGAEDSAYHAAVSRCLFVSAVARIFKPGCKVDTVPILEGVQGAGKSSILAALFDPWFSDDLAELGSKDAQMQMQGVWCVEIAELASMRRADINRTNAFMSRRKDRFRPAYGRSVVELDRQCIFVGTTNSDRYLTDETGARRFWPVECGRIDLDALGRDRDQLWAEARELYRNGTEWWLSSAEIVQAVPEQDARYTADAWTDIVANFVANKAEVSVAEILLHIGKPQEQWAQLDQNRVVACLKMQRCWQRRQRGSGKERRWIYARVA